METKNEAKSRVNHGRAKKKKCCLCYCGAIMALNTKSINSTLQNWKNMKYVWSNRISGLKVIEAAKKLKHLLAMHIDRDAAKMTTSHRYTAPSLCDHNR